MLDDDVDDNKKQKKAITVVGIPPQELNSVGDNGRPNS